MAKRLVVALLGLLRLSHPAQISEEFGHEWMEPMSADPPGRLPQDLGGLGHLRPIAWRAARPRSCRRRPWDPMEQPDGGLAMNAGDSDDLIQ